MDCKKIKILKVLLYSIFTLFSYDYDVVVIGAGAAGLTAAEGIYNAGKKVLLIEKKRLGGGRIWSGDIPFKIFFKHSYNLYHCKFLSAINSENLINNAKKTVLEMVRVSRDAVYQVLYKNIVQKSKIPVEFGSGYFINPHTFFINGKQITAHYFFIATGSHVFIPPLIGLDSIEYYTRENFFELEKLPDSITILGGGPLGTELASSLNRLGVKVTLIMHHKMLLPSFDEELVESLVKILEKEGVQIVCNMKATEVVKELNGSIKVIGSDEYGQQIVINNDTLFIATGSIPNVKGLGLESIGVEYTKRGIRTNEQLQTTVPNIYAIGDVVGSLVLTRVAYYHAKLLVESLFGTKTAEIKDFTYKMISKVIFTHPSLAMSGLTEIEALRKYGEEIEVYRFYYNQLEKAHVDGNPEGFVKFICDKKGILLGVHVLGEGAGDIVDFATIGESLYELCKKESKRVRTSPHYLDVFQKIIDEKLIKEDSVVHNSWFFNIMGW